MFPLRLNIITYNIWNTERWAFRSPALGRFLELFDPDILCVQELRPKSRDFLDGVLANHQRVHDRFAGWNRESNVYWRASMFAEIEHGAEDVEIKEAGHRRLFWARLQSKQLERPILVATAHLTHQRHPDESRTGQSPRVGETKRIIEALKRLNVKGEPLFFMGDLNDPVHPPTLLHAAGYASCFAALGLQPPPTFKCYPTADVTPGKAVMNQAIDWLVANGEARVLSATVPHFYFKDAAPSDHWPVQAVYEIDDFVNAK
jgi:endonuclease/exonuclease/phosphatase family metal-dependent hydrolase